MTDPSPNKPLRIVMILASLPPMPIGGAEIQAIQLCKQLNAVGIETEVITWGKIWHKKKDKYNGISFTRLSSVLDLFIDLLSLLKSKKKKAITKIVYDDAKERTSEITGKVWIGMISRYTLFYINSYIYLCRKRKTFDIIHAHMMEWPAFTAAKLGKKLNKPVIIKDSTMNGIFSILRYPGGVKKQREIIEGAHCVAMTKMIHDNLVRAGVRENSITTIPNGIEIFPLPHKTASWSNKVVFVGNLTQQPAKGLDILLKAWKIVSNTVPEATLEIIGNGDIEAYQKYSAQINIEKSVTFAGRQSNVKDHLNKANVFVLPSRREGMSNALMEAMLCGLPVVATDVSGSQDLIENKVSGLLVPPANPQQLADAIIYMLTHPNEALEMGKKGYGNIKDKCDIQKVAAQYETLYYKIANRS